MVALEGQHRALETKALSKVVPSCINALRLGICPSVLGFKSSALRSSVRIRITLGGLSLSSFGLTLAEGKQAESAQQAASSKRKGKPPRIIKGRPALAASDDRGTGTAAVYSLGDPQARGGLS